MDINHVLQKLDDNEKEQILNLIEKDPLTNAYNRRKFNEDFSKNIEQAKRHNQSLILLMIDIDHFKKINDEKGHLEGDIVLTKVSDIIQDSLRKHEPLYRYGGEEFAIILTNQNLGNSKKLAERLREDVKSVGITISIGISAFNISCKCPNSIIKKADQALYHAKNTGRDKIIFAEPCD